MIYSTGDKILVGDLVCLEGGRSEGKIVTIIDSNELLDEFDLQEFGVMIKSDTFGLLFVESPENDQSLTLKKRSVSDQ